MENEFQAPSANTPSEPSPSKKPRKRLVILTTVIALCVVVIVAAILVGSAAVTKSSGSKKNSGDTTPKATSAAATKLYDALGKGAAQQSIRVAQLRKTFATKANLENNANPGFIQSSVSEVDASTVKYRALYAQKMFDAETFRMQRCMDGTAYIDGVGVASLNRQAPQSLAEANEYLKQMYKVTEDLQFIICPHVGVMPGGTTDVAPARLSDGLMPVTLSDTQAAAWKAKVQAANLFDVKDEGMVERSGRQLHKYSFAPRSGVANTNQQLYNSFYVAAEIEKIKHDRPGAEWQYEFIAVNRANSGSVEGFYLIDDQTGLPAYSELRGINPDNPKANAAGRDNIGFNKQTYAYPTSLTLTLNSPLEFLQ